MTHIAGPGSTPPVVPLSPPPPPAPAAEGPAAPAPAPSDSHALSRAQDALTTMGLSLEARFAESEVALDGLVDEAALPLDAVLRAGSDPAAVRALQSSLNALGQDPPLEVDGLVGPLTRAAVSAFQGQVGLTQDGLAGPNTNRALMAVEAMALAAASKDPAESAELRAHAQELISGIQPAEQQVTLQGRLDALPATPAPGEAPALPEAEPTGSGAAALGLGDEADDFEPQGPPMAPEELAAGVAKPEEVAEDARGRAEVEALAEVGGEAAVAAEVAVRGEDMSTGALVASHQELLDDFFVGNGDARAAGEAAAHLVNEDPSRLDALWNQLQSGAGANNKEAFIEGFLSELDPEVAVGLPRSSPETIAAMADEYNFVERLAGDPSSAALAALVAASEADPTGGVGESTDAAIAALEAANEAGSILDHITPEWIANTSDPVVLNRAFQLLCHDRTSGADAERAGQVAAALLERDPSMAQAFVQQFDDYDWGDQGTFNNALVGAMSERTRSAVGTISPAFAMALQQEGGLTDANRAAMEASWAGASPEAQAQAFGILASQWTGRAEAIQMGKLAAQLANRDPALLDALIQHFDDNDVGDTGPFVAALAGAANPALRARLDAHPFTAPWLAPQPDEWVSNVPNGA